MATILIADDDPKLVGMLRRILGHEGYDVLSAPDGRQALDTAQRAHPDLLVLDWMMPELTGPQVAQKIRDTERTPILMLTARDSPDDRLEGLRAGADDYLTKPFATDDLLDRIRSLLGQPAAC
jgi:DNA-binding response OmpR family regulator